MKRRLAVLAFLASTVLTGTVWAQANFYEGKTVTVLIGAKSGRPPRESVIVSYAIPITPLSKSP